MSEITDQKPMESDYESRMGCFLPSLWVMGIAVSVFLALMNLFWGELNQDEGWYLYAARLVRQGKLPYVDFASTQGPVMPFVYSLIQPFVDRWGMGAGRFFTMLLGFAGSFCAAWLAARLAPVERKKAAAFLAFALCGVNIYQSYFCTVVKTYALSGLFIVLGFLALSFAGTGHSIPALMISGVLFVAAAGTRISAGVVPVVIFIWLLVLWRRRSKSEVECRLLASSQKLGWFWFGLGVALACCAVFGPFLLCAPTQLKFALLDYHVARKAGGFITLLAYKAGFVSRVVQAYFVAVVVGVGVLIWTFRSKRGTGETRHPFMGALWLSVLAVTLVHIGASVPYDDYQVIIFPVCASALAVAVSCIIYDREAEQRTLLIVFLLCIGAAFSSPINMQWFVSKQDRIWWPIREQSPLAKLRETGKSLRTLAKRDDLLLTQDSYLAVESGMKLPPGLELGPFSYFPDWTPEKARTCHVLNKEMMIELLEKCDAPVAAFSGYGLVIRCPDITKLSIDERAILWKVVLDRYTLFREIDDFGQAGTRLGVYLRK